MAIPPGSLNVSIDFQNPACFTNGGTAITDLSGNGKNFTLNSTSYTFDNTNGSITMPNGVIASSTPSNFLYGTSALSMLCWVNIGTGSYQTNICRLGGDACGSRLMPYYTADNTYFIMDGACTAGAWPAPITPGWHLLAITRPANCLCGDQKFYIDGVYYAQSGSYQPFVPMDMNNAVFVELNDGYAGVGKPLNIGTFDLYTTEVSAADILTIYNNEVSRFIPTPPALTPIAEYDFQNGSYPGSGTTVFDLSGTGNTLAITSGGTWVSGTPNYFNLNNNTAIYKSPALGGIASTNVFSMNLWYYDLTEEDDGIVFYLGQDFPNEGATFGLQFGNQFAVSGGFGYGIIPVSGITSPGWNFISYVSTGSSTTAYLNGASVGSTTNVPSIPAQGGICLGTGLSNGSPPVPRVELAGIGRIGYASIFNVALGSTEITDIYNATVSSYPSPPLPPVTGLSNGRRFGQGFPQ